MSYVVLQSFLEKCQRTKAVTLSGWENSGEPSLFPSSRELTWWPKAGSLLISARVWGCCSFRRDWPLLCRHNYVLRAPRTPSGSMPPFASFSSRRKISLRRLNPFPGLILLVVETRENGRMCGSQYASPQLGWMHLSQSHTWCGEWLWRPHQAHGPHTSHGASSQLWPKRLLTILNHAVQNLFNDWHHVASIL